MLTPRGFRQFLQLAKHSQATGECMALSYGPQLGKLSDLTPL